MSGREENTKLNLLWISHFSYDESLTDRYKEEETILRGYILKTRQTIGQFHKAKQRSIRNICASKREITQCHLKAPETRLHFIGGLLGLRSSTFGSFSYFLVLTVYITDYATAVTHSDGVNVTISGRRNCTPCVPNI